MQPNNQYQQPQDTPPELPVQPASQAQLLTQPSNPAGRWPGKYIALAILLCVAANIAIGVFMVQSLVSTAPGANTSSGATARGDMESGEVDETEVSVEPVELVKFSRQQDGLSVLVPVDMEMEYAKDDFLEGMYSVRGGTGVEGVGNRFVHISKYVSPELFSVQYDKWLDEQIEYVESGLRSEEEAWPEGIKGSVTFQSTTYVGDYKAYTMRTKVVSQPRKKGGSINVKYVDYLSVYISPTIYYSVSVQGNGKDTGFTPLMPRIIESFSVK